MHRAESPHVAARVKAELGGIDEVLAAKPLRQRFLRHIHAKLIYDITGVVGDDPATSSCCATGYGPQRGRISWAP